MKEGHGIIWSLSKALEHILSHGISPASMYLLWKKYLVFKQASFVSTKRRRLNGQAKQTEPPFRLISMHLQCLLVLLLSSGLQNFRWQFKSM